MTENVIIQILKDNKKNGIGWNFLPEQVKIWTRNIVNYNKCIRFDGKDWISLNNVNLWDKTDNTEIIALSEDFELKKETEGEWVEFEIDKDSFEIESGNVDCPKIEDFDWWDWQSFLSYCRQEGLPFTAFGGWQYRNCKAWFMQAMLFQEDHYVTSEFEKEPFKTEPAIPIKIRFWRISK